MARLDGTDDVFDSRDVIGRIEELEAVETIDREPDDQDELDALYAFEEEAGDDEWRYGQTFISDDYFEEYAQELAEEIGAIDPEATWPLNRIDWEAAADDLKIDYTSYEFHDTTYWTRS